MPWDSNCDCFSQKQISDIQNERKTIVMISVTEMMRILMYSEKLSICSGKIETYLDKCISRHKYDDHNHKNKCHLMI